MAAPKTVDATDALVRLEAQGEHVLFLRPGYILAALPALGSTAARSRKNTSDSTATTGSHAAGVSAVKYHDASPAEVEHVVSACVQNLKLHQRPQSGDDSKGAGGGPTLSAHEALCLTTTQELRVVVPVVCGVLQRTSLRHAGIDDHMCNSIIADTLNLLCSFASPSPAFSVTVVMNEGPPVVMSGQRDGRLRSVQSIVIHAATLPTVSRRWQENPVLTCLIYSAPLSLIETVGGPAATSFVTAIRGETSAPSLSQWLELWGTIERIVPVERDGLEVVRLLLGIVIALEVSVVDDALLRPRTVHDANGLAALLILLRRAGADEAASDESTERQLVRQFLAETQSTADPVEPGVRRLCVVADELASFLVGWILDCSNNTLLAMTSTNDFNSSGGTFGKGSSMSSMTVICSRTAAWTSSDHLHQQAPRSSGGDGRELHRSGTSSHSLQGLFSRGDVSLVASQIERRGSGGGGGNFSSFSTREKSTSSAASSSLIVKQLEALQATQTLTAKGAPPPAGTLDRRRQPLASNVVSIRHLPSNVASDHIVSWAARLHHVEGSLNNSDEVVMQLMKGRGRLLLDLMLLGSRVSPSDLQRAALAGQVDSIARDLRGNLLLDGSEAIRRMFSILPSPPQNAGGQLEDVPNCSSSDLPVLVVRHAFGTVAYDLSDVPWLPTMPMQRSETASVSLFSCLSEDVIRTHSSLSTSGGEMMGGGGVGSTRHTANRSVSTTNRSGSIALDNAEERRSLNTTLQLSFLKTLRSKYNMVPVSIEALFSIVFKRVENPVFLHLVPSVAFPLAADARESLKKAVHCSIASQLLVQQLAPKYVKSVPFDHFCRVFFPILQRMNPHALRLVSQRQAQEQLSDADFVSMICMQLGLEGSSFACSDVALMLTGKGWADLNTLKTADEAATRHERLVRQAAEDAARLGDAKAKTSSPTRGVRRNSAGLAAVQNLATANNRSVAFAAAEGDDEDREKSFTADRTLNQSRTASAGMGSVGVPRQSKSSSPSKRRSADEPPWKRAAPCVKLTQNVAMRIESARGKHQTGHTTATPKKAAAHSIKESKVATPVRGAMHGGDAAGHAFNFSEFDSLLKEQLREH